jgi:hypothetical protein
MQREYQFAWQQGTVYSPFSHLMCFNRIFFFFFFFGTLYCGSPFPIYFSFDAKFMEFHKHYSFENVPYSSHRRHFELKTQQHGELFSLMHHVVLGDDPEVKQGKPSPDIFLAAAKRFEV